MKIEGACLCGKVRYSADAEPAFVGLCHCKDCQKETGTAFNVVVGVPQSALSLLGALNTYRAQGGSGKEVRRRFCPECGASIVEEPASRPDLVIINGGTLDDPTLVTPGIEIYRDRELSWVRLGGMPRYPGMPV